MQDLKELVEDIARAIHRIDQSGVPFKGFQPGVGPYGEPQLVKLIASELAACPDRYKGARTCRTPDLLVPLQWALEFKIVRPFGDNGVEAEHWSQNLLHPYPGNVSALGDAMKLSEYAGPERTALIVIAYEHDPPKIELEVLLQAFEMIATSVLRLPLGPRCHVAVDHCIHPVHQRANVFAWKVG